MLKVLRRASALETPCAKWLFAPVFVFLVTLGTPATPAFGLTTALLEPIYRDMFHVADVQQLIGHSSMSFLVNTGHSKPASVFIRSMNTLLLHT